MPRRWSRALSGGNKRARQPRACGYTKGFAKDWERLDRSGRHDMRLLKDHALKGEWTGFRECHVGGDFLLIYELDENVGKSGRVNFVRAGTHSELFRE